MMLRYIPLRTKVCLKSFWKLPPKCQYSSFSIPSPSINPKYHCSQIHENHAAKVVLVHEPGLEAFLGSMHATGALFEKPVNLRLARLHHTAFRQAMSERGVEVVTVRDILSQGCEKDLRARLQLEDLALRLLAYQLDGDELVHPNSLDKLPSSTHDAGKSIAHSADTSSLVAQYLSDTYKKECISAMGVDNLVDMILIRPTIHLVPSKINTPLRTKNISLTPNLNLTFTRDQQIVTPRGVVINRMGSQQRLPETIIMKFCFEKLGIPIIGEVQEPGLLEGGDYYSAGNDLCLIGTGLRTNMLAVESGLKSDWFGTTRVAVVRDLFDCDQQRMHLDTVFNICGDNVCTMLEDIMGRQSLIRRLVTEYTKDSKGHYVITKRDMEFSEYMRREGYEIIPLTQKQQEAYGLNYLNLGNSYILSPNESAARTMLGHKAFQGDVQVLDYSGMTTMYGSLHCCSQVLFRARSLDEFVKPEKNTALATEEHEFYRPNTKLVQSAACFMMVAPSFESRDCRLEYSAFYRQLTEIGINTYMFNKYLQDETPLASFPTHIFSTHSKHETGLAQDTVVFYPTRKLKVDERRTRIINRLKRLYKNQMKFLENNEDHQIYLEANASIIFDRLSKIGYYAKGIYTNGDLAEEILKKLSYQPFPLEFQKELHIHPGTATTTTTTISETNGGEDGTEVESFTNTALFIGTSFVVVCTQAFKNGQKLLETLKKREHRKIIEISLEQRKHFCTSLIEARNNFDEQIIIMSNTAHQSFTPDQLKVISQNSKILRVEFSKMEGVMKYGISDLMAPLF